MMSDRQETGTGMDKDTTVHHAGVWMPTNGKTGTIGTVLPIEVATAIMRTWLLPSRAVLDSILNVRMEEPRSVETVATTLVSNCKK